MKIVADQKYKTMFRLQWPDGSLSTDFYNRTRAEWYIKLGEVQNLPSGETRHVLFAGLEAH